MKVGTAEPHPSEDLWAQVGRSKPRSRTLRRINRLVEAISKAQANRSARRGTLGSNLSRWPCREGLSLNRVVPGA
jgi:hypothetical protein